MATAFEVDDAATDKAGFIASLDAGEWIEAEGSFTNGVLVSTKVENDGQDS